MKKSYYILIGIAAALILSVLLKPGWPKAFYKRLINDHKETELRLQKEIDSIQEANKQRNAKLQDSIFAVNEKLMDLSYDLQKAKQDNAYQARKLRDYRYQSYDERFKLFTRLISETDSIQR